MSAVHFDQLIINAAVSRGVTSGTSFQQILWGLSDPWGSKFAYRIVFAAVTLFQRYDLQGKN